jgi:hypothetical protein
VALDHSRVRPRERPLLAKDPVQGLLVNADDVGDEQQGRKHGEESLEVPSPDRLME